MEDSEYERQRQENIAKNKALLKQLQLDSLSASLSSKKAAPSKSTPKKPTTTRIKKEREPPVPRRTSSRLAGLPADSASAKRKSYNETQELEDAERPKRTRVAGDLSFEIKRGLLNDEVGKHDRTFTQEDVKKTGDKGLKAVRERLMGLKLWDRFEPNALRITPERIYHLEFHPTVDKPLIFAADKVGNLGILNATADSDADEPDISSYKLHARTISTFFISPAAPEALYTSSYDASIRRLDLHAGKSTELYVAQDDDALSGVNALDPAAQTLLFSTLTGMVGRYDTRTSPKTAQLWECSEKKIGGLHVHPGNPNIFATASLDRTVKLWDLRRPDTPLAAHTSRLSVSSALWSATGKVATTSYDDTVKIYNPKLTAAAAAKGLKLEPAVTIRHNNQTGRWLTILRAVWQEAPEDGVQKLVIANMNRAIDIFGEDGRQLAQLVDEGVTAVPAVARSHPTRTWIAGGTASGKIVLFT